LDNPPEDFPTAPRSPGREAAAEHRPVGTNGQLGMAGTDSDTQGGKA